MAQPLRMHQIRRIIECQQQQRSIRETVKLTGLSRNTVREYLRRISLSGLDPAGLLSLDDASLGAIVYTEAIEKSVSGRHADSRYATFEPLLEQYVSELRKRGVTRLLLWQEYLSQHPNGYGYTQFCDYLKRYLANRQTVMHFTHQPGEQLQVDFAGDKLGYVDRETGEWISCEVLVCVLPYSHYMYSEALRSQQLEELTKGLCRAMEYIGGVAQSIKFDNMRTVVTRSNRYEPVFTEAMEYFGAHYGTTVLAARAGKPRDKASVEKAVDLSYKHIYAPLRHQTFFSLEELNAAIRAQVELINTRPFKAKPGSRRQLFERDEKDTLKPLPSSRYQIRHVTQSKVQRNYHVILGEDRHQYSVPYTLVGKRLKIIYTSDTVEVYDGLQRVALHRRSYKKNGYTTLEEHRPTNHRYAAAQRGWDKDYFPRQATVIGPSVHEAIERVLASKGFYEQTYNSCLGILRLAKQYGNQRLEAACARASASPTINYGIIANILKNHLDTIDPDPPSAHIPPHDQIRGPQTYQ